MKKLLLNKRKLPSFINKHFNIEELDKLISCLTTLSNERKEAIQQEEERNLALQELAQSITLELKEHNIQPYQLIQHLRNQST